MKPLRKISLFLLVTLLFYSCGSISSTKRAEREIKKGRDRVALKSSEQKDSLQHELLVWDPNFDFWVSTHRYKRSQYSNEYLASANRQYALEWNRLYSSGDPRVGSYLDYDPTIKYDFELNFKLFLYFKYFEDRHQFSLIPGSLKRGFRW